MGKPTGFKEYTRELPVRRPVELRILDWQEVYNPMPDDKLKQQGARCMDCGIPFCNNGCPLGNIIPEWNDLVYKGRWKDALAMLHKTNNFPEFTGRICPAPCEEACVLSVNDKPVTIKLIEQNIIDHAWANGYITPEPPKTRTGKKVAVIGSGPAGLAAAAQLNKAGHLVTVFERADRIGGLLTYGIPEFKMEKAVVDRRVKLMEAEGITFKTSANVGENVKVEDIRRDFDAIVLCNGATAPRDLKAPGRELNGVHFAMDYLPQANKRVLGDDVPDQIDAKGKHVIILGGGDTGADCLGTALRQGAKSIKQFELLPRPPEARSDDAVKNGTLQAWPYWPMTYRVSSAHEEAIGLAGMDVRDYAINTERFSGDADGNVKKLHAVRLEWKKDEQGRWQMNKLPNSEFELDCDLCFLAMGFVGPEKPGPIQQLGLTLDPRGNVVVDHNYMTNVPGVFSAGDIRRGQSLVVWAISEGRCAAHGVDKFLMGKSDLPYLKLF
ncbi:glutamate synthase subunit beta [Humisphaera borealis]|uniref:Glutamate synthase subunit beta n=1 Tax=Humisphaera borealis TaxID=2807512 RepID=A0A7M2WX18_9BACT|nr:glutamate synthase subunit beta [Humisphaera borealis]QOV90077.1 glutamate synthase subunit beta [Humisphaera borealis]